MKKQFIVISLFLAALLLSACGAAPEAVTPAEEETAVETAVPAEAAEEPAPAPQKETATPEEPTVSEETPSAPQQEPALQPPVGQSTPVQQDPAPANNGGSGSSGSGSGSSSGTYSDGSISHNGTAIVNGSPMTGLREFASVSDLNRVGPVNNPFEIVSVGGTPYIWTGTEWADYSGFYTEVEVHDLGEWDGTYVGY